MINFLTFEIFLKTIVLTYKFKRIRKKFVQRSIIIFVISAFNFSYMLINLLLYLNNWSIFQPSDLVISKCILSEGISLFYKIASYKMYVRWPKFKCWRMFFSSLKMTISLRLSIFNRMFWKFSCNSAFFYFNRLKNHFSNFFVWFLF